MKEDAQNQPQDESDGVPFPPFASAARQLLDDAFARLSEATLQPNWFDDEALLKAARIAARRLRANVQLLGPRLQPKRARRLARELELLTSALGAVRDYDVVIGTLLELGDGRLEPVLDRLHQARAAARRGVERRLSPDKVIRLRSRLNRYESSFAGIGALPSLASVIREMVRGRYRQAALRCQEASPANLASIHAARRALRRLRYALESFAEWLGPPRAVLRPLKRAQDLLGRLNDLDMTVLTLRPLLAEVAGQTGPVEALDAFLALEQRELNRTLLAVPEALEQLTTPGFRADLDLLLPAATA